MSMEQENRDASGTDELKDLRSFREEFLDAIPEFAEIEAAEKRMPRIKSDILRATALLLKETRFKSGHSQADLAVRMQAKQPALSRLETPVVDGKGPTISSVAKYLNFCGYRLELKAVPIQKDRDADLPELSVQMEHSQVADVANGLGVFFVETDDNDVILRSNSMWKDLHKPICQWTENVAFADFLKAGLDCGLFPDSTLVPDWFDWRMDNHRRCSEPFEITRQDGIILRVNEAIKPDGGIVTMSKDVSFAKAVARAVEGVQTRIGSELT